MIIDPSRHESIFSPYAFGKRRVDVIGVGATGSRVVLELAKMGIENIHVWDFDKVEEHNIANQMFGLTDVGKLKVEAMRDRILRDTGTEIQIHVERVDGTQTMGEVVFLLTDTMSSRKEIWANGLKHKLRTKLMIETRMGASHGRVYVINPNRPSHIVGWESTLYDDVVAEVSACGAPVTVTVGPTAGFVASLAVIQLIRWFNIEQNGKDKLENEIIFGYKTDEACKEIIFGLCPMITVTRLFQ